MTTPASPVPMPTGLPAAASNVSVPVPTGPIIPPAPPPAITLLSTVSDLPQPAITGVLYSAQGGLFTWNPNVTGITIDKPSPWAVGVAGFTDTGNAPNMSNAGWSNQSMNNTISTAFGESIPAGDDIMCFINIASNTDLEPTVTDSVGNTYTQILTVSVPGAQVYLFLATNVTAVTANQDTATLTLTSPATFQFVLNHITNLGDFTSSTLITSGNSWSIGITSYPTGVYFLGITTVVSTTEPVVAFWGDVIGGPVNWVPPMPNSNRIWIRAAIANGWYEDIMQWPLPSSSGAL